MWAAGNIMSVCQLDATWCIEAGSGADEECAEGVCGSAMLADQIPMLAKRGVHSSPSSHSLAATCSTQACGVTHGCPHAAQEGSGMWTCCFSAS